MTTPTPTTVQVKIQLRRDTAATWASVNPVLLAGEAGLETDTNKIKIGNGSTAWNSLGYFPFVVNGGTVTGNLEIGTTGTLTFEGSSADNFETTLGVINPTADRTINLPNVSGTIITTGDTGTVTSTMIADGTIVNADVSASAAIAHSKLATITAGYVLIGNASNVPTATQVTGDVTISNTGVTAISSGVIVNADIAANAEIAVSKLANGTANQVIVTDGTNVSWSDDLTLAGNLTVNGTTTTINTQDLVVEDKNIILGNVDIPSDTTADGGGITLKGATDKTINWVNTTDAWTSSERFSVPLGSAASPSLTFTGDENTGIYSPGADQVAISTGGSGRLFVDASGNVGLGSASPTSRLQSAGTIHVTSGGTPGSGAGLEIGYGNASASTTSLISYNRTGSAWLDADYRSLTHQFFTSGSERLRITSAGLVGVGTSAPVAKFQINVQDGFRFDVGANAYSYMQFGSANAGEATGEIGFERTSGNIYIKRGAPGSPSTALTIDNNSRVGIGTTSPVTKHHVSMGSDSAIIGYFQGSSAAVRIGSSASPVYGTVQAVDATNGTTSYQPLFLTGSSVLLGASGNEHARIDSSGRLLVGTSSAITTILDSPKLQVFVGDQGCASFIRGSNNEFGPNLHLVKSRNTSPGSRTILQSGDELGSIFFIGDDGLDLDQTAARIHAHVDGTPGANDMPGRLVFSTTADGASSPTERMRIRNDGTIYFNTGGVSPSGAQTGSEFNTSGYIFTCTSGAAAAYFNRNTSDGTIVELRQDNVAEGSITVSGTTVSYNGAHLSRWSQLPAGAERTEILRGTVLSNIDEMCEWGNENNEQLNRMKVSDVEGDKNVSGVFQAWDDDDDTYTNDFYCAMTGDFIIRIAAGVTVERGDLLMSAGDGTAKPQDDDTIRSKTIAKVTSTNVSCTYEDGSYCVPCVLMAC